ncbi:protein misato homolog 1 [Brachypodium distachyon]|uniref:DML1/Misato tubulin domain-containing protein n=1 Tax=Brachypodium distachyon TaxID=15368 RepID=I1IH01_BRADI|nr:protein misato homolog 1 [Brachypodium distachyon]KQJ86078.1 hypothetical protein BRADI_4g03150v3 [Brachypodium distachyon]|eukprot:XP_003578235.1 protein misato homolog 1 [Brachypodium distachyon]
MREVVTVQVGGFANFVGSHFWNFQDELLGLADDPAADAAFRAAPLDMDALYRAGETLQGVSTYCPRLVSVGSRGSLGSLSSSGTSGLSSAAAQELKVPTWSGNVTRSVAKPHGRNLFLESLAEGEQKPSTGDGAGNDSQKSVEDKELVECLENGVNFWTDYTKVQYHPQSLYELNGSWTNFDKFDHYGTAREVVSEWSQMEEMNERLRFFVEECDHIQGIQFILDDSGGFSSVAAHYLENIADDYTNTPVLLYCVRDPVTHGPPRTQRESMTRSLHDAVSFSKLSSFCNLMVPIGLPSLSQSYFSPFLSIQDVKPFHSSAVSAAAIHSVTVPFRLQNAGPASNFAHSSGNIDIGELVHIISGQGWQNMVTALDVAMPAPSLTDGNGLWNIKSLHSLTPEISDEDEDPYSVESLVVHGVMLAGGQRASISQVKDSVCSAYEGRSTKPKFSHLSVSPCPLAIPLPFPSIFRSNIGRHGEILSNHSERTQLPKGSLDVESVPMAARLRSSNAILPFIERRSLSLQKLGVARGTLGSQALRDWGFGKEEIEDMSEHLSKMVRMFHPEDGLTSDSD